MQRVVVTGMGLISALGQDLDTVWDRLHIYKNAVRVLPELKTFKGLNSHLGSVIDDFQIPQSFTRKTTRTMGKVALLATASADKAVTQAGLLAEDLTNGRTGVAYGSSSGSPISLVDFYEMLKTHEVKTVSSGTYIKMMPQTCAVNLSLYFKTTGRLIPTNTACTSGALSIGLAYESIKYGLQDVMIAGGAEEFSSTQVAVFDTLYATSTKNDDPQKTPIPFDKNRDGLVIGEGAGTLILESLEHAQNRGAKIYAEIVGFGTNTDGAHITQPSTQTMALALKNAISDANISTAEIGYVNAHGTATLQGDIAETTAVEATFQRPVAISSLKSYIGHTLGACGTLEAIITILMLNNNWYAPTLNLNETDPACAKLDYIKDEGRAIETCYVMSNNFAFGGINTSLIFKKFEQ